MKLISSKSKQEVKQLAWIVVMGFLVIMIRRNAGGPLVCFSVLGVGILIERIIKIFKKEVRYVGITIFIVSFMALFFSSESWNPWGEPILLGFTVVYFLIFMLFVYKRTRMIYITMGNVFLIIAFFIRAIENLIIPEGGSWSLMIFPAFIFMCIMQQIEKKKNPEKMKEWEETIKKASFFEVLSFKHIPKIK